MILVASSSPHELAALSALCHSRDWIVVECDSVRATLRQLQRSRPRVVVLRHSLQDGYSDYVLSRLPALQGRNISKTVVLLAAGSSTALEARQITLGADCVLRDPLRPNVFVAYLGRFLSSGSARVAGSPAKATRHLPFAGGVLLRADRNFQKDGRTVILTPREVELIELLAGSPGAIVTYETLYSEILGRVFRGDTSNMRVLLGKLTASAALVGVVLRDWIKVVPKSGYIYSDSGFSRGRPRAESPQCR